MRGQAVDIICAVMRGDQYALLPLRPRLLAPHKTSQNRRMPLSSLLSLPLLTPGLYSIISGRNPSSNGPFQ